MSIFYKVRPKSLYIPMLRYLPDPINPRRFHLYVRVDAMGNGTGNEALLQLLQTLYQLLLLIHIGVYLPQLRIKERDDGTLLGEWRNC